MTKILFVPRTKQNLGENPDAKIPGPDQLQERWSSNYQFVTLDDKGLFQITDGDQVYVMGGHGEVGSGVVTWGNKENGLAAETVAARTAERFPDCGHVAIKVHSCHSCEGGYESFAQRFARAFRPVGRTYEVTIYGYRGRISSAPHELTYGNVHMATSLVGTKRAPEGYRGPKESVKRGESHRWSKVNMYMFQSRASEAREKVAWLKATKGSVWQRWNA